MFDEGAHRGLALGKTQVARIEPLGRNSNEGVGLKTLLFCERPHRGLLPSRVRVKRKHHFAQPRIVATHDPSYGPLIREQTKRRTSTGWAFYSLALVSTLTLILVAAGKGRSLIFLTLIASMGCFWLSLWLHKKECEIYHRNIVKYRPP